MSSTGDWSSTTEPDAGEVRVCLLYSWGIELSSSTEWWFFNDMHNPHILTPFCLNGSIFQRHPD
jgi:hypothetical protein